MALKSDSTGTPQGILVDGVSSPAAADAQAVEIILPIGAGAVVQVAETAPLPVRSMIAVDYVTINGARVPVTRVPLDVPTNSTDDVVLAAQGAGQKIYVVGMVLVCGANPTTLQLRSKPAGASTAISPTFPNGAYGGATLPAGVAWFVTNANEALTVNTNNGGSTIGCQFLLAVGV